MKDGLYLITKERNEQILKHGFDYVHDKSPGHCSGELVGAAIYLLAKVPRGAQLGRWPETWDKKYKEKFDQKNQIDKLAVAGALIAAEIDRLQRTDR